MSDLVEPALRFLHYAVLLGLFGWTAFRLIGLQGLEWLPQARSNAALFGAAIAAPLLTAALMLAAIAAMMGVPITALDWPMTEAMILGTDMGWALLVRVALLVIGAAAILASQRMRAAAPIAVACFAGALMTLGWSGHAAATEGALGLAHRLNNGAHLLAVGLWLGAIGWFLHLTVTAHRRPDNIAPKNVLGATHRFAPLGVGLVASVAVTGLINAHLIFGLENSIDVLSTPYGLLLAAKIALVGSMLAFGAHNARIGCRRKLAAAEDPVDDAGIALPTLRHSLAAEFVLAASVTALVAALGTMSPMQT